MKTSVMEVHDMLSVLSVVGVEKRIGEVPGVESVTVNFAGGNATVRYDEARLDIADIKSAVRQIGYQSDSESPREHASEHKPAGKETPAPKPEAAAASVPPTAPAAPKPPSAAPAAAPATPAGDGQQGKATANAMPSTPAPAVPS